MTPNEKKALDRLNAERDKAELAMATARNVCSQATSDYARARKAYRRALEALNKYRDEHA